MATSDSAQSIPVHAGADAGRPLALVTGASSGIGLELARQLAERGHDLIVCAEDAAIHQVAAGVGDVRVEAVQADLATREGCETLVARCAAMRPLDVCCLNAGIGLGGPFLETDLETELRMIQLNCSAVVHLAKALLPRMVQRGQGRVLVTASIAASMPAPFEAVYGATKAFDLSLAEALRNELKDTGVTVTALQPGPTETNFFHRGDMDDTRVGASDTKDDPATVAKDGLDALFAGRDKVVAGSLMNKVQDLAAQVLPEPLKAQMHRKLAEPGSAPDAK